MKVRNGFVSNSSSSSFIIGVKGELTKEKLIKTFDIGEKSPLYPLAGIVANVLINKSKEYSKEEFLDYYHGSDDEEDLTEDQKKIFDKGFNMYSGSAQDGGYGADESEAAVCHLDFDYEDDDIIIKKRAGY